MTDVSGQGFKKKLVTNLFFVVSILFSIASHVFGYFYGALHHELTRGIRSGSYNGAPSSELIDSIRTVEMITAVAAIIFALLAFRKGSKWLALLALGIAILLSFIPSLAIT